MALFHLFPIPASKISLAIQISGAVFLLANLFFVKKIAERLSLKPIVSYLAVVLTAFYVPLNNWGLQGMEVSILTLTLTATTWLILINLQKDNFSPWPYVILGLGTLVRIDIAVPYLVILLFLFLFDAPNRARHILWGIGLLVLFLGSQTLLRYVYYGNPLPNTYYLKMAGFPMITRIKRGGYVLIKLIKQMNWVLIFLPFTILYSRRDRPILLLFLLVIGQVAYSVYVGGDAWEHRGGSNRYIALSIPLFFILFVYSLDQILEKISNIRENPANKFIPLAVNVGLLAVVTASMVNFNFLVNTRSLERWLLLRQPNFIEANKEYIHIANALKQFATSQTRIAVVTAGAIPYFSELPAIDLLGKNDPFIAHQNNHLPANLADIRPGHMKWDYDYAIGQLKPDVVVQLWGETQNAEAYLKQNYTIIEVDGMLFSVRTHSPNILWEKVKIQP
ncbi:MAG: glycosyltransferase family 39 protein [Anaerolineales bacterium]|nr:glycosyltransferase family 39 protein [Anaerolineales bacterium]